MFYLPLSLKAYKTPTFASVLKKELRALNADLLPLQQGLQNSSYAISDKLAVTVLAITEDAYSIKIKAGLLYNGIIAGCSCADDPTPLDETNEYCDVLLTINKSTAASNAALIND